MLCEADSMKRDSSKKRSKLGYFVDFITQNGITVQFTAGFL